MTGYNDLAKNYIDDRVREIFVLNTLEMFFKRFHKFIFEIKPVFL